METAKIQLHSFVTLHQQARINFIDQPLCLMERTFVPIQQEAGWLQCWNRLPEKKTSLATSGIPREEIGFPPEILKF
jgi:hypothetical protein